MAWFLYPDYEAAFHQKDGLNVVKLGLPGGQEAVYNADTGALITDPDIYGTYNYFNPEGAGYIGHAVCDFLPYLIFGKQGGIESHKF